MDRHTRFLRVEEEAVAGKSIHPTGCRVGNEIIRDWEIARAVTEEVKSSVPIRDACDAFIEDCEARHLKPASIKKYLVLLLNEHGPEDRKRFSPSFCEFCAANGIQFTTQVKLETLSHFRAGWKDGALSGSKKIERLRAFGRFLVDRGWWRDNVAAKLKRPVVKFPPTMPYTDDEIAALMAACDRFTDWHKHEGQPNAQQLRAFILFLRYSALRIGACPVAHLEAFVYSLTLQCPIHPDRALAVDVLTIIASAFAAGPEFTGCQVAPVQCEHQPVSISNTMKVSTYCRKSSRLPLQTPMNPLQHALRDSDRLMLLAVLPGWLRKDNYAGLVLEKTPNHSGTQAPHLRHVGRRPVALGRCRIRCFQDGFAHIATAL